MADTSRFGLPLLQADQALKHITHNEALVRLDGLIQLTVEELGVASPPGSPVEGEMYDVASGASGDWSGHDGDLALWTEGGWRYFTPGEGWLLWDKDSGVLSVRVGGAWIGYNPEIAEFQNVSLMGINTTAATSNRLAVSSDAALFTHDASGSGDMRVKVNKINSVGTASHLFQTDFNGFAEFGLLGDNDFHVKVSPDNFASSFDALTVAAASGAVTAEYGVNVGQDSQLNVGAVDTGSDDSQGACFWGAGATRLVIQTLDSAGNATIVFRYYRGTTEQFRIRGDGDLENSNNNYGAISDVRLKQDIEDAGSQWQDIKSVRLRHYRQKAAVARDVSAPVHLGVIAQEIAEISPGLVRAGDDDDLMSVKYSVLYLKAIGALQEAMVRIERLEQKLAARA